MEARVMCRQGETIINFDGTESSLFNQVGQLLRFVQAPDTIRIIIDKAYADIQIGAQGAKLLCSGLTLQKSKYEKKYLTRLDPETNKYEFFRIIPYNMGQRTICCGGSFGRIGAEEKDLDAEQVLRAPFRSEMYWIKYYEKLLQGYQDITDYIGEEDQEELYVKDDPDEMAASLATDLYNKLRAAAKETLSEQMDVNFLQEKCPFTKKQVTNGWKTLNSLNQCRTVKEFNDQLLKLIAISPRKVDKYRGQSIQDLLAPAAKTEQEQKEIFAAIIDREESLIRAMEVLTEAIKPRCGKDDILSPFGNIEISEPTKQEIDLVYSKLSDELKPKVKKVYRVHAIDQQQKFDTYRADRNISETKLLWHGSRNENWISIIRKSLQLNPNAAITGKMWGQGIYFAPSSMKSWGYTSVGRYVHSSADTVYMGLYETAYGTPYCPTSLVSGTQAMMNEKKTDCIHAKREVCGLLNDEIIFYSEDAICIQYLVEFAV